jgi:hypothetical protein
VDPSICRREGYVSYYFFSLVRICVLLSNAWWRLPEDGINSSPSNPHTSGDSNHQRVCVGVFLVELDGFGQCSFGSTILFIGDGCCSRTLVPQGLSMTTPSLSTATSFASSSEGGGG